MNWKAYFKSVIAPFLRGEVLEVGAGIGGTTAVLCTDPNLKWTCLEPDPRQTEELSRNITKLSGSIEAMVGTLAEMPADRLFDCILYMDVLEHIEDDRAEFARAAAHLKPGGTVVILSPAHQWLYSPFDKAIGHYRRYSRGMLRAIAPEGLKCEKLVYLDSLGVMLSATNRMMLRRSMPKESDIRFWDSVVVPMSRWVDRVTFYNFGKSVVGVWQKM